MKYTILGIAIASHMLLGLAAYNNLITLQQQIIGGVGVIISQIIMQALLLNENGK